MPTTVQSVERAFAILETLDEEHRARTAAEIAEVVGLSRPTTYRMLQTLQQLGYVRNTSGRFEVTPRVLRLAAGFLGASSLAARAQPVLDRLTDEIGEQVALGILDGDEAVALAATTTRHSRLLSIAVHPGQRMPAHTTSLGRILLAHLPGADDPESVAIREAGHVITDGLLESGLRALGVPVRAHDGTVVASLSIGVIAGRVSVDELRERCLPASLRAAEELSQYV